MPVLDDETRQEVGRRLATLPGPVHLVLFTAPGDPGSSEEVAALVGEIAALSERVTVEEHALAAAPSLALRYGISRAPALVVEAGRDYGIRYYGAPSGHEFESLLEVMGDVARGASDLEARLVQELRGLREPVHIQVFVTPT
jgi:alkyl hydroperoxide reductase subunit AhpF